MSQDAPTPVNPLRKPAVIALFVFTAALFLWMLLVTGPAFERAAGAPMLDGRVFGYTPADVADLHARVKASPEAAVIANNFYRTLDFIFPALLALSLTILAVSGFAALARLGAKISTPVARLAAGAISVPYLVLDLRENGLAQALFSAPSLAGDTPLGLARMLPTLTAWKFSTFGAAVLILIAIWFQVFQRASRQPK